MKEQEKAEFSHAIESLLQIWNFLSFIEIVSAALFPQASPDSQNNGERRQKSSDYLLWRL